MTVQGKRLFCGTCKKHVQDLTRMTEDEAHAMLASRGEGELCVRYLHDAYGDLVFQMVDTRMVPVSRLVRAKRIALASAAAMSLSSVMACAAATPEPQMVGGAIACPIPTGTSSAVPIATSAAIPEPAPSVATPH